MQARHLGEVTQFALTLAAIPRACILILLTISSVQRQSLQRSRLSTFAWIWLVQVTPTRLP